MAFFFKEKFGTLTVAILKRGCFKLNNLELIGGLKSIFSVLKGPRRIEIPRAPGA